MAFCVLLAFYAQTIIYDFVPIISETGISSYAENGATFLLVSYYPILIVNLIKRSYSLNRWTQRRVNYFIIVTNIFIISPLVGILSGVAAFRAGTNRQILFAVLLLIFLALLVFESRPAETESTVATQTSAGSSNVSTGQTSETRSSSESQTPSGLDIMEEELVDRDDIEVSPPDE